MITYLVKANVVEDKEPSLDWGENFSESCNSG